MGALPLSRDRTTGEFRFHIQSPVMVYSMLIFGGLLVSLLGLRNNFRSNWIYPSYKSRISPPHRSFKCGVGILFEILTTAAHEMENKWKFWAASLSPTREYSRLTIEFAGQTIRRVELKEFNLSLERAQEQQAAVVDEWLGNRKTIGIQQSWMRNCSTWAHFHIDPFKLTLE